MQLILALLPAAAAISFGGKPKAKTFTSPFASMPGAYGPAANKGLAYSFGKEFSVKKFPGLVKYVQEAEIKHARIAMLAAAGFPLQESFHPLFGGEIDAPSYIAFQASPLQTFWPIVVGSIFLLESASYVTRMENPSETGKWWSFKDDALPGNLGWDPLRFGKEVDLRSEELLVGRIAMLGIAGMVLQELATQSYLFTWFETI
mmetsp:Transcript_470/g.1360  ORF Transcript_470/g.1360 Transcript_470/m.1360 type:complete len:203 (-) Transcript_470:69-677(-)|eukprot:CAMPEP_0119272552 /NCGR_PEP_ID=MMETSP1329-20130426/8693_1 /TAXON_ID=114041 /ORGANISM="Genus nov. species nov., Strain RCC1024" /LENGTH=202 /DNA_ID=CAMNT_0007272621 /DNA_START=66 /DNA_END=674 /DNA_ORIENTATION=+